MHIATVRAGMYVILEMTLYTYIGAWFDVWGARAYVLATVPRLVGISGWDARAYVLASVPRLSGSAGHVWFAHCIIIHMAFL